MNALRHGLAAALMMTLLPTLATPCAAGPLRDPVAGPLEVFADAHGPAQAGTFVGAGIALANHAPDAAIDVILTHALVRWADGSTMRLDLGGPRVHLDPGASLIQPMMMVVPPDAPLGLAVLEVRAHVARVTPTDGTGATGHRGFAGDGQAADAAAFIVVP